MASSSSTTQCFNRHCSDREADPLRGAWPLRKGDFAMLCHPCASYYEEGKFCDVFHRSVSGWRNCESCGKPLHCGCVVSVQEFVLSDEGGVICMSCIREEQNMATNQISPPSLMEPIPISERLKDLSDGKWNDWRSSNLTNLATSQSEVQPWMPQGVQRSNDVGKLISGMSYSLHHNSCVNTAAQSSTPNDDPPLQHVDLPLSCGESKDPKSASGSQPQRQIPPPSSNQLCANTQNGVEISGEIQQRNGRPRGDARGRNQLSPGPRYWPRVAEQELDSNTLIKPLFEKILSASDAGRIGRLVLPKRCAEAYLPSISQPEGIPLEVQDLEGHKWTFQFRFWPNNNSRMYVLEGVTSCIQSMKLAAGDTVIFSRLEPEGKLVLGYRKASYVPPSDQDNQTLKAAVSGFPIPEVNSSNPANMSSKAKTSGCIPKDALRTESSSVPGKRRSSKLGSRGKRPRIESEDPMDLNVTVQEAQHLFRSPPNSVPTFVLIDGFEIEEHEEPPVIGKPTIFSEDNFGSSCSMDQEFTAKEVQERLNLKNSASSEKTKSTKKDSAEAEGSEGLDTLANLAILGEGMSLPPSSHPPTTRHPRHKVGCTCIVCIQPPSGQLTKHSDTCECTACLIMKRRFCTMVERRRKNKLGNETETRQHRQHQPEKPEMFLNPVICNGSDQKMVGNGTADDNSFPKKQSSSLLKAQIDLNIQPERDDEPFAVTNARCMMRPPRDVSDQYVRQQEFVESSHQSVDQSEPSGGGSGGKKLKSAAFHGGC